MDFSTNYCGMYYSDGKIQSSVADGASKPVSALDEACRDHDTAYANALDDSDRDAADNKFYNTTDKFGIRGQVYGRLVKYGNQITRKGKMAFLLPFGALIGASLGSTAILSGMLPGKGKILRGSKISPEQPVTGVVYDPETTGPTSGGSSAPAGGGFVAAVGTSGNAGVPSHTSAETSWNSVLTDPGLMQPIGRTKASRVRQAPTRLYKPLKKKRYTKTLSMVKLYEKYNPPKNKTNKISVKPRNNG